MNKLPDKVAAGDETEVQLAPWGVYPQYDPAKKRTVEQIVDEEAGRRILAGFDGEILVDADHGSENGGSTEALAWITALRADPESGLWARMRWTDKGAEAVSARRFRFVSPAWHMAEDGRPYALSSVALTNRPNIQAKPILNQQESAGGASAETNNQETPNMDELKKALGLAPDADEAAVLAAVQALQSKVSDLEAAQLNAEADAFAEEHRDKAKDPEVLKNAYKKDPELAKSLVLNMKAQEPKTDPAKRAGEIATAATRILTNRAPVGPGAGMSKEQARERLASLPHEEQAEFYRQNAALIDG